MDEGADIGETLDFYNRVFDEVSRVKKAMGGRIGYADGPDDPKKKSFIKKIPKVGKVVSGLESLKSAIGKIMNRFGEDAITTADKVDQPEKTTQQLISEFESRNPNIKSSELEKTRELAPKMVERFELKDRIPGIDDELLTNIIEDPDPQHKAEVIAMLEEAFSMLKKGKGTDEVIDILEQSKKTRKDNAQGGLNYLMGL
jgi:hypothetical protein